jgi:hypothetical protein
MVKYLMWNVVSRWYSFWPFTRDCILRMKMKVTVETPKSKASVDLNIKDEIPSTIRPRHYAEHFLVLALESGIEKGLFIEESNWVVTQHKKKKKSKKSKKSS